MDYCWLTHTKKEDKIREVPQTAFTKQFTSDPKHCTNVMLLHFNIHLVDSRGIFNLKKKKHVVMLSYIHLKGTEPWHPIPHPQHLWELYSIEMQLNPWFQLHLKWRLSCQLDFFLDANQSIILPFWIILKNTLTGMDSIIETLSATRP